MGKNRHSKDRLFITATEWATEYGGKKTARANGNRPLPFDHCALSLGPFVKPALLGKTGVIFDLENITKFVKKYKHDPVTGEEASEDQIIELIMEKNEEGHWHCPITRKVFNDSTHVVAVRTSKYVYSHNAVNELNIQPKNYVDIVTGEKFKKSDIITIQNPQDPDQMKTRDVNNFKHLQKIRADATKEEQKGNKQTHNSFTERVMKELNVKQATGNKRKLTELQTSSSSSSSVAVKPKK